MFPVGGIERMLVTLEVYSRGCPCGPVIKQRRVIFFLEDLFWICFLLLSCFSLLLIAFGWLLPLFLLFCACPSCCFLVAFCECTFSFFNLSYPFCLVCSSWLFSFTFLLLLFLWPIDSLS